MTNQDYWQWLAIYFPGGINKIRYIWWLAVVGLEDSLPCGALQSRSGLKLSEWEDVVLRGTLFFSKDGRVFLISFRYFVKVIYRGDLYIGSFCKRILLGYEGICKGIKAIWRYNVFYEGVKIFCKGVKVFYDMYIVKGSWLQKSIL